MKSTILITGANRGIGLELARLFSQYNWDVIACCRNPDEALALKSLEAASEGRLKIEELNVTDDAGITALAQGFAHKDIDILLNSAGIMGPENQEMGRLDEDLWLETFRVNTIGPYRMACAFRDHVAGSRQRIIATITSEMGSLNNNTSGNYYAYRTSKAGANMVMKNLSLDLHKEGITCVALHPGWVRTSMGGSGAPLSPEESARGLFQTLKSLEPSQNGSFLDYRGRNIPW